VRWPERVVPRTVSRVLQHVDLAPTVLDALGVAVPQGADRLPGRSLRPCLMGRGEPDWAELASAELAYRERLHWMVRDSRYKLIWHGEEDMSLFDLALDPGEIHNLAGDPMQAARVAELKARFDETSAGTAWNVRR
jgi:arylsulfatase A-like enzyme